MEKKLLVIGMVWPEPNSSAAGWRMLQLVALFQRAGYQIHFASAASKSPYSHPLTEEGIVEQPIALNDSSFDSFISKLKPDVVLFDRFMVEEQYSWRVKENCPEAIRILDTEDLHFLRHARQRAFKNEDEFEEQHLHSELAKRELAAIYRSDLSILISTYEYNLLQEKFNINKEILSYLPFQVQAGQPSKKLSKGFLDRANFAFIGNFLHEPNWKTVQNLKMIWPAIRMQLPKAEMHIYGAYPSQKVLQLNNPKQGFLIKGRADHAVETLAEYRVLLAPIPFGAGLKGKFIDALYAKTPSVTSPSGAEGMLINDLWNGFIGGNEQQIIQFAITLYSQQQEWENAVSRGELMLNNFSDPDWGMDFLTQVQQITKETAHHRDQNFIGEILWSKQFAANKYLSLWIQEKNRCGDTGNQLD